MIPFVVEFEPSLPFKYLRRAPRQIEEHEAGRLHHLIRGDYLLCYIIDGKRIAYYPDSLVIIMGDLQEELTLIETRRSHLMTISGYPVLGMEINNGVATFVDLAEEYSDKAILGLALLDNVEIALKEAMDCVWSAIKTIEFGK